MDLQDKRHEILRIAALHGARNIRVFGSVARGDNRPGSDVDRLVEMAAVITACAPRRAGITNTLGTPGVSAWTTARSCLNWAEELKARLLV